MKHEIYVDGKKFAESEDESVINPVWGQVTSRALSFDENGMREAELRKYKEDGENFEAVRFRRENYEGTQPQNFPRDATVPALSRETKPALPHATKVKARVPKGELDKGGVIASAIDLATNPEAHICMGCNRTEPHCLCLDVNEDVSIADDKRDAQIADTSER